MTGLFAKSAAVISDCGRYRYTLTRSWDESMPFVVFIMLNPSTADEEQDDPTIRRCRNFATAWGMGGFTVVNLFAYRTPYPTELVKQADPVGPANDSAIRAAIDGRQVVAAWGACERYAGKRIAAMTSLLVGHDVRCLGFTEGGQPRHPLMLRKDVERVKFQGGEGRGGE